MADGLRAGQVVLVGMMGSGKTTVGGKLARRLDLEAVDTDTELVAGSGLEIDEWFTERGEAAFRAAEHEVLARVLDHPRTRVVATGGGVVVDAANRALLVEARHTVVWLRASPAFLASRIERKSARRNRPLLGDDPRGALEELDARRRDLYGEVADVVIDIETVMAGEDKPRKTLSRVVADTLERLAMPVQR